MGSITSKYKPVKSSTMSSSKEKSSHCLRFTDETFNLFTLIWLDEKSSGDDLESLNTKKLLLDMKQDCLFYNNYSLFLDDIDQMKFQSKKTLLIVSGSFVENVSRRYSVKNSISIVIIFCRHYYKYAHLKKGNVVDICVDHESLKNSIEREMPSLKLNLFENQPLKSIRSLSSGTQDAANNGIYFIYILFIELLRQMPQTPQSKETMLNKCEDYYRGQEKILKQIDEFRCKYKADHALKWYTRNTFVYTLVNRAFRTEDITLWYMFRYYIIDLCMQLEEVHQYQKKKFGNRRLILYRGQSRMSTVELKDIQTRIGSLVATNAFMSTSEDRNLAIMFASGAPETIEFKAVLYEIHVVTNDAKNIIFVDVADYFSSQGQANDMINQEKETLFMIGSVFKIESVYEDKDADLWHIKMKATDEGTNATKQQIQQIKEEFQTGNMNRLFGRLLVDRGYYEKADSYFQLMIKGLPKDHPDLASVYDSIGDLRLRTTKWKQALEYFDNAYMIKKKYRRINHPDLGITYNNIANYYKAIGNNDLALNFYRKSLKCVTDSINTAITQLNIATILKMNGEYLEALKICNESSFLLQQLDPYLHAEIIICQGLIGDIYCALHQYETAEAFYLTAFSIAKKVLFIGDCCLIRCIDALANIYEKLEDGNQSRSVEFCQEQLSLHKDNLPENHVTIAHIFMKLGVLSNNIDYYLAALTIFERNRHQEYVTTARCLMLVAQYCDNQNMYEEALLFYERAYEIQKDIYPENHSLTVQTETLIDCVAKKFMDERLNIERNGV